MIKRGTSLWAIGAAGTILFAGLYATRRDFSRRQIRIFSEMAVSPAGKAQASTTVFADGRIQRAPVAGTAARGAEFEGYGSGDAERARAAVELKNPVKADLAALTRGKEVFSNFCAHCHGPKGRGDGAVARAFSGFAISVTGKATYDLPDGELFHIASFGRNLMPGHASQIGIKDRWKAVHYLRDLQDRERRRLGPLWAVPEDPRRRHLISVPYGKELFAQNCSACHGEEGRRPKPGIPTLNTPAVLAIADDAFYWDIIRHGKKGTQMPAWEKILTPTQVKSLVLYVRSWSGGKVDRSEVLSAEGTVRRGRAIFYGHCAGCHGSKGEGGIGVSLRSETFQALVSDEFLRDTITFGRGHTPMPANYDLNSKEVRDVIAYIRSFRKVRSSWKEVQPLLASASQKIGKSVYRSKCAGCHGKKGEGGIGSRLNSQSFLARVDDKFLYDSLFQGRPGTAMPAWTHLESKDAADVIGYIRAWQTGPAIALSQAKISGDADHGEMLFTRHCKRCHGGGGKGELGAQLANPVFQKMVPDQFLWDTIAHGKDGTDMSGFLSSGKANLSPSEINDLVAYLRRVGSEARVDPPKRDYAWANKEAGREIFEKKAGCASCHGSRGEGGSGPALGNPAFLRVASDGFIAGMVILGRTGTEMRSFYRGGNVSLEKEEVENVVAYIRDFAKRENPLPRRWPSSASTVAEGSLLFAKNCQGCHGTEGHGSKGDSPDGYAPALNSQEFLRAATDDFLLATIAIGRPNTPMRPFSKGSGGITDLSAEDIRKVVAYIRSWEKK